MIAYLGCLFDGGKVGHTSVGLYVSTVNTTLRSLSLRAPADISHSTAHRILPAGKGYQKRRKITSVTLARIPMPFTTIHQMAEAGARALRSGVLGVARDCVSLVFQFFVLGRPDCQHLSSGNGERISRSDTSLTSFHLMWKVENQWTAVRFM